MTNTLWRCCEGNRMLSPRRFDAKLHRRACPEWVSRLRQPADWPWAENLGFLRQCVRIIPQSLTEMATPTAFHIQRNAGLGGRSRCFETCHGLFGVNLWVSHWRAANQNPQLRSDRETTVFFVPLTLPSPLRRGEEAVVNYFSICPYRTDRRCCR